MKKKSIAIDMDDVIADCTGKFIRLYNANYGSITKDDLYGKEVMEAVPQEIGKIWWKWLREKGFFRDLDVIPGSKEALEKLCQAYQVYIVSAASEFRNSYEDKYDWLQEHFPFISWKNIVFCGDKSLIYTDYLIDDRTINLDPFRGKAYLFSAPHNMKLKNYDRIDTWKEAETIFL